MRSSLLLSPSLLPSSFLPLPSFFQFIFLVFPTSLVGLVIPLLMLCYLRWLSTVLRCFSPPRNQLGFRSSFSNLDLVFSTSFAQPRAGRPCSPTPQLPIGTKRIHLVHHMLANALCLPHSSCCSYLLAF